LLTLGIGFFPPSDSALSMQPYTLYFMIGLCGMILPVFGLYFYKARSSHSECGEVENVA
jgi:hypothetical protein